MTTLAAVAAWLGVTSTHVCRWCAELDWSPGQGYRDTLTVGQAVGLEVYGTLAQQHTSRRQWEPLAHTTAVLVDQPRGVRWIVHVPHHYGADHQQWYADEDIDDAARYIGWHTRRGHQVIVVDLHDLAGRWADSPPCPPPSSSPSPFSSP